MTIDGLKWVQNLENFLLGYKWDDINAGLLNNYKEALSNFKKMKILYISHLHPPKDAPFKSVGGMQRVSMQLVKELKSNPSVTIKTIIQHAPWNGIEIRTAVFLAKLARKLPLIVNDYQPDVILFSSMVTASLARLTRKIDVPMVTINHGQDVKMPISMYQKFVPSVFEALDGVISVSRATREECIKRGMNLIKVLHFPMGLIYLMRRKYQIN